MTVSEISRPILSADMYSVRLVTCSLTLRSSIDAPCAFDNETNRSALFLFTPQTWTVCLPR